MRNNIVDLRSALEFLASIPGQLVSTRTPVDPVAELAGVYKLVGAGTPLPPPTRTGPAMLFENVKGYDMPVVVGVLASRERTALLMNSTIERLPFDLLEALNHPCAPVAVTSAACQEVVIRPPFDLRRLIPAPTHTLLDAGPYFNMGLLRAEDPETGQSDVTIHRLCVQGPDRLPDPTTFAPHRSSRRRCRARPHAVAVRTGRRGDQEIYSTQSCGEYFPLRRFRAIISAGGAENVHVRASGLAPVHLEPGKPCRTSR